MFFNKGHKFNNEEFSLVLGGGGAKGAYQIGAWRALKENGIKFNSVIGTSVGALNGALFILDLFDEAVNLWENITTDKVIDIPNEFIKDGQINITSKSLSFLNELQQNIFKNGGLDTSPLRNAIENIISEEKIRKLNKDFGIVTFELNSLKPVEIFLDDIPNGKLIDYLIASSSLPGFKLTKIGGKKFLDGGLYDVVPFNVAKRRGYNRIIVIDISGPGLNKKADISGTSTIYIKNSLDTGNLIDFNPISSKRNIKMGYLDTKKVFGSINGINYFYKYDEKIISELEKILFRKDVFEKYSKYLEENIEYQPQNISRIIRELLPSEMRSYKDIIIPIIELAAESLKIEILEEYDLTTFIDIISKEFETAINENIEEENLNTFENILSKIKATQDVFNSALFKSEDLIKIILNRKKTEHIYLKTLSTFYPFLIPALIFSEVVKTYKK